MKNLVRSLAVVSLLGLAACQQPGGQEVRIINQTSAPNLPDIVFPSAPDLEKVMFDLPPSLERLAIRQTPECVNVPAPMRDLSFWKACGDYVTVRGPRFIVSLDEANYRALINNLRKLRERDAALTFRLELVNRQRREQRLKNRQPAHQS